MPFQTLPIQSDFERYYVTNKNFSAIVRQPLYDHALYPAAGAQLISFFQTQVGQGVTTALGGTVGSQKTLNDTNMQLGGQLPNGLEFMAEAVELSFFPGSVSTALTYTPAALSYFATVAAVTVPAQLNDENTFWQGGRLELRVLAVDFLTDAPLVKFVPRASIGIDGSAASNSATTSSTGFAYAKPVGDPYYLEPPIALQPTVAWGVSLIWPAVVPLPSGFNARVGCTLQGYRKRAGQ